MNTRFNSDEWASLTPTERAQHCEFLAQVAITRATSAPSYRAARYHSEARDWMELALEFERDAVEM